MRKIWTVLFLITTVMVTVVRMFFSSSIAFHAPYFKAFFNNKEKIELGHSSERRVKEFVYLTMTEECIPDFYLEHVSFGNPDNRDVFVLSYRSECKSLNTPAHVTYLFRPHTTWTTGRNALYYHIREHSMRYKYYIFLDDDVYLYYTEYLEAYSERVHLPMATDKLIRSFIDTKENEKAIREIRNNMSSWRFFEKSLLEYSPALSVANLGHFESRLQVKNRWGAMCGPIGEMPWVTPTFFIDTNLIAIHREALPMLLPHSVVGDHISWYLAAVYFMQRAKSVFYRQLIAIWRVSVLNTKGRPYPKNPFPDNYLDLYWNTKDGKKIKNLIDIRDRNFVMFYRDNGRWKDVYFGNPGVCTAPLKFPISEHYQVTDVT